MPTLLKDIPKTGILTPEEVEALSNRTFDYADRERVSIRAARQKIKDDVRNDFIRSQLFKAGDIKGAFKIPSSEPPFYSCPSISIVWPISYQRSSPTLN